jgi:hypothetical protein
VRRVSSNVPGVFGSALDACSSMIYSIFARPVKNVAGRQLAYGQTPSRNSENIRLTAWCCQED